MTSFFSLHNTTGAPLRDYSFGSSTPVVLTRTSIINLIVNHIVQGLDYSPRNSLRRLPLELSIDAIVAVAEGMKEDLQRQANQGVLRNDLNRALGALASINAIDDFVYRLKMRAGSQLGLPKAPRTVKSPLRKHLEAEQLLPHQLLLPNVAGPIPAKKRKSA